MDKFWKWMRSKDYNQFNRLYFDSEKYDHVSFFPNKTALIGYMIQYLMEETDINSINIELVKINFSIEDVYELMKKEIERKIK